MKYQGAEGRIAPNNITPQCLEYIWKDWGETCMWENTQGL